MEVRDEKETAIQGPGGKVFQAEVTASPKAQSWDQLAQRCGRLGQRSGQEIDCALFHLYRHAIVWVIFSFLRLYLFVHLFMAVVGLCCCTQALLFLVVTSEELLCCGAWACWGVFSCCGAQALECARSVAVAQGVSCSKACGIIQDQGSNLYPLHWQVNS